MCHAGEKQISAIGDPLTMQIDLPAWLIRYRWVYILHVARINGRRELIKNDGYIVIHAQNELSLQYKLCAVLYHPAYRATGKPHRNRVLYA